MQKVETYTNFKINENAYRWRDDQGCWYTYYPSTDAGFRSVPSSENDLLEQRYQESIAHAPDYEKLHRDTIEKLKNSNQALKNSNQTLWDTITVAEQRYRKGYQQGYNSAIENIKSEMEVNLTRLERFRDNQLLEWRCHQTTKKVVGPPEYPLSHHTAAGKVKSTLEPADYTFEENAYNPYANLDSESEETQTQHPVNEPTRPSEEDMINRPSVNTDPDRAYTEGVGYDQHPQFRDIGIRIDRYGKLVFKPELSNEED